MWITVENNISMKIMECGNCGTQYAMRADLHKRFEQSKETFYCPNGHQQHYGGKSEAQILKEQLQQKNQELSNERQARITAENKLKSKRKRAIKTS